MALCSPNIRTFYMTFSYVHIYSFSWMYYPFLYCYLLHRRLVSHNAYFLIAIQSVVLLIPLFLIIFKIMCANQGKSSWRNGRSFYYCFRTDPRVHAHQHNQCVLFCCLIYSNWLQYFQVLTANAHISTMLVLLSSSAVSGQCPTFRNFIRCTVLYMQTYVY